MSFQGQSLGDLTGTVAAASQAKYLAIESDGTNGDNNVKLGTAGGKIVGVTRNATSSAGEPIAYTPLGHIPLQVDGDAGAISDGSWLKSDASGQGVATTTNNDVVFARARAASTTAGEVIMCDVFPAFTLST